MDNTNTDQTLQVDKNKVKFAVCNRLTAAGPVPIYFNAKDIKFENELNLLKQYQFDDSSVADGIGFECMKDGIGIAFWKSSPTEKDKNAGAWYHAGRISTEQMVEFRECFRLYDLLGAMHKDMQKHVNRLKSKSMNGFSMMMDDRFRRSFMQCSRMQMKINSVFRKIWFKRNFRSIA